jgi:metallo-beta-lactamase class B
LCPNLYTCSSNSHPDISGWQFDKPASPHPEPLSCAAYADRAEANMRKQLEAQRAAAAAERRP